MTMTEGARSASEPRDIRLKRLRIRSWRRGIREMDLILGRFAETGMAALSDADLDLYEALLAENDHDLYAWVARPDGAPQDYAALLAHIADGPAA